MPQSIADRIAENRARSLAGRESERALLASLTEANQPPVWFLHGIAGIGKSTLARVAARDLETDGAKVIWIDCRSIPPTQHAFMTALAEALRIDSRTPAELAGHLDAIESPVVLILDEFESFRLLETWLRQEFIPSLPAPTRIVLISKLPPSFGWSSSAEWNGLMHVLALEALDRATTDTLFLQAGFSPESAKSLAALTRGHPLAIQLAIGVSPGRSEVEIAEITIPRTVDTLTRRFLEEIPQPENREIIEAAAIVRRATRPMLGALLPDRDTGASYDWLAQLPFVEVRADGLGLHDSVQNVIAQQLRSSDPQRYRTLRLRAWNALRAELRAARQPDLWRLTADLLFLLENPALREGFFPSGNMSAIVEPSLPADYAEIRAITDRHGGPAAGIHIAALLANAPNLFSTVRTPRSPVAGFMAVSRSDALASDIVRADPILSTWANHLRRNPLPGHQRAIYCREALGAEYGELPSEALAATWIGTKRLYIEMRPALGRTYATVRSLEPALRALSGLGFRHAPGYDVDIGGITHHTIVLDFGPDSIDGWLAQHLAIELAAEGGLLDVASRALRIDDQRVPLSRLEFAVMRYLVDRPNEVVPRTQLLQDVWGIDFVGGSNVVDVVILALRQKLGPHRSAIQTVHGAGYRFVPPP